MFSMCYANQVFREQLKKNYNLGEYHLEVSLNDLKNFDEEAAVKLRKYPSRFLPAVCLISFYWC